MNEKLEISEATKKLWITLNNSKCKKILEDVFNVSFEVNNKDIKYEVHDLTMVNKEDGYIGDKRLLDKLNHYLPMKNLKSEVHILFEYLIRKFAEQRHPFGTDNSWIGLVEWKDKDLDKLIGAFKKDSGFQFNKAEPIKPLEAFQAGAIKALEGIKYIMSSDNVDQIVVTRNLIDLMIKTVMESKMTNEDIVRQIKNKHHLHKYENL